MSKEHVPLESSIIAGILRYLRKLPRCRVSKRHGGRLRGGDADIFGCLDGRHLEIEVKRRGNKPTPRQLASLRKWEDAGAVAGVAYSVQDVRSLLRENGFNVP